jgi:hypothetical protein
MTVLGTWYACTETTCGAFMPWQFSNLHSVCLGGVFLVATLNMVPIVCTAVVSAKYLQCELLEVTIVQQLSK